jgi:hypothetical protein
LAVLKGKLRKNDMPKKVSQEKIVYALKQAEAGVKASEICLAAG